MPPLNILAMACGFWHGRCRNWRLKACFGLIFRIWLARLLRSSGMVLVPVPSWERGLVVVVAPLPSFFFAGAQASKTHSPFEDRDRLLLLINFPSAWFRLSSSSLHSLISRGQSRA